jgi:hypothetical protein
MSTIPTLRMNRRFKRVANGGKPDATSDLHAELVLLREENQRLRTAGGRSPDLATLIERVRRAPVGPGEDPTDEAAAMLAQDLVIRESLVEICRSLRRATTELEEQLLRVGVDA